MLVLARTVLPPYIAVGKSQCLWLPECRDNLAVVLECVASRLVSPGPGRAGRKLSPPASSSQEADFLRARVLYLPGIVPRTSW